MKSKVGPTFAIADRLTLDWSRKVIVILLPDFETLLHLQ